MGTANDPMCLRGAFRWTSISPRHCILSARTALTSGLACNAPNTTTEAIVARASSGVTSAAIVARPNTLISSISPARRAASRSCRAIVPQTEIQALSGRGLFDDLGMAFELVADCGSNEVGSVRIKALLKHQIDMAEVDEPEIDRDLFTVTGLGS